MIDAVARERITCVQTQARAGLDSIYARVAVNETDRPPRRHAPPHVGRERDRRGDVARREVGLDHELRLDVRVHRHAWTIALALLVTGCQADLGDVDNAFFTWDARKVHCAVDLDASARNSLASIDTGLDRAKERGEVLELYAHHPGVTLSWSTIEHVLAGAQQRGLAFLTYADLVHGAAPTAGLLLSFDDSWVDAWTQGRPLFQQYGARVTFFIAYYPRFSDGEKTELRALAGDGHDIEAHTISHQRGPAYVEAHGLRAYLDDEVVPSIELLRDDGYEVTTFAYPFGSRTDETDRAILRHVSQLRSVSFTISGVDESPCPY